MSLDAIRSRISSDAEKEAKRIEAEAADEAGRILDEASSKAKEITRKAQDEAKAEADRMKKENSAALDSETEAILMDARNAAVDRALKQVKSSVEREIFKVGAERILKKAIKEFTAVTGSKNLKLKMNKRNAALLKGIEARREYDDTDGFVIENEDGTARLVLTPEGITEKYADAIRKEVAASLFKGNGAQRSRAPSRKAAKPKKVKKIKAKKVPKKVPVKKAKGKKRGK